jgi:hypothetical protein
MPKKIIEALKLNNDETKVLGDLLDKFDKRHLEDLSKNIDLLVRDLKDPAKALVEVLGTIVKKCSKEEIARTSMQDLFIEHLPEEYRPDVSSASP